MIHLTVDPYLAAAMGTGLMLGLSVGFRSMLWVVVFAVSGLVQLGWSGLA